MGGVSVWFLLVLLLPHVTISDQQCQTESSVMTLRIVPYGFEAGSGQSNRVEVTPRETQNLQCLTFHFLAPCFHFLRDTESVSGV